MGIRKGIGALVLAGAIYAGGVMTSDKAKDRVFYTIHRNAQVEQGYCSNFDEWKKEKRINQNGNIETYLVHGSGYGIPCLEGELAMQVGPDNYVIENISPARRAAAIQSVYAKLPAEQGQQKAELAEVVWDVLNDEQRVALVLNNYDELCPQNRDALADELMGRNYRNKWDAFKKTVSRWYGNGEGKNE